MWTREEYFGDEGQNASHTIISTILAINITIILTPQVPGGR